MAKYVNGNDIIYIYGHYILGIKKKEMSFVDIQHWSLIQDIDLIVSINTKWWSCGVLVNDAVFSYVATLAVIYMQESIYTAIYTSRHTSCISGDLEALPYTRVDEGKRNPGAPL